MNDVELQVFGKLRNYQLLDRIQSKVLGNKSPFQTAGENGWNHRVLHDAERVLEDSAIKAKDKINKHNIKYNQDEVFLYLRDKVIPIIISKDKDRAVATRVINRSPYESIKFLNAILRSFGVKDRMDAAVDILCILYPKNDSPLLGMECHDK
jgi:hypothetical protein